MRKWNHCRRLSRFTEVVSFELHFWGWIELFKKLLENTYRKLFVRVYLQGTACWLFKTEYTHLISAQIKNRTLRAPCNSPRPCPLLSLPTPNFFEQYGLIVLISVLSIHWMISAKGRKHLSDRKEGCYFVCGGLMMSDVLLLLHVLSDSLFSFCVAFCRINTPHWSIRSLLGFVVLPVLGTFQQSCFRY